MEEKSTIILLYKQKSTATTNNINRAAETDNKCIERIINNTYFTVDRCSLGRRIRLWINRVRLPVLHMVS